MFRLIWPFPNNLKPTRANCHHSVRGVKNWHISGNSFSTSPFTQSLLWLWLWLWFCWTQKMVWKFWLGESGACFPSCQPSHGPCTSPCILAPSEKFFASIQSAEIEQPSKFLDSRSIHSLHQMMEQADGSERLCAVHAALWPSVSFRILLSHWTILSNWWTILSSYKWLILLRFFVFVQFAGQFLSPAQFMPNFQWKYFHQKPE